MPHEAQVVPAQLQPRAPAPALRRAVTEGAQRQAAVAEIGDEELDGLRRQAAAAEAEEKRLAREAAAGARALRNEISGVLDQMSGMQGLKRQTVQEHAENEKLKTALKQHRALLDEARAQAEEASGRSEELSKHLGALEAKADAQAREKAALEQQLAMLQMKQQQLDELRVSDEIQSGQTLERL